ncbi:hypothetical protein [Billgrantia desiderata]|mgnify:CR=1 FL=1|uniref:hypothetical protein n=1 Tax=Billgrantia desiderata TaxID=52021 RepID=UPI00089ECB98|nr:hypothetical protein [Halomonas desiderata]SEF55669.1 hypothetical protein SAMN04487953_102239 [Halomonas desiderata]
MNRTDAPGRGKLALLEYLQRTVPTGIRWALRGGRGGLAAWLASDTVKDLDLWVHSADISRFLHALSPLAAATVSLESDPRWLRHLVLVMPERFDHQLIDITYGDLKVGGALTCREALVATRSGTHGPMLAGVAAVSDLLLRKLLRGKRVDPSRLAEATLQWHQAPEQQRRCWLGDLGESLGSALQHSLPAILSGRRISQLQRATFLLAALRASLHQGGISLALRRRRRLVLGRRFRVPLKRPVAPVMFYLAGSEAGGLAHRIEQVLFGIGVATQRIDAGTAVGRRLGRLAVAGIYGQAVIVTGDRRLSRLTASLFGGAITFAAEVGREEILKRYYLAAHRWYIDDTALAGRLAAGESAGMDLSLRAASTLP